MYGSYEGYIPTEDTTMAAIETIYRTSGPGEYAISQSGGSRLLAALAWLSRQIERRRSRIALLEMSDDQLKDIGLSRSDAHGEARRRFWD
jgi:uncharacterized protein YjiS (DUF1127 family)